MKSGPLEVNDKPPLELESQDFTQALAGGGVPA